MIRRPEKSTIVMGVLLLVVGFLTAYPLGIILVGSFRPSIPGEPAVWSLAGWQQAWSDPGIPKALFNTFLIDFIRTPLTMGLAVFFTWIIIRTNIPRSGLLEFLLWISYFLPNMPLNFGWIQLLDPDYGALNQFIRSVFPFWDRGPINIYSYGGIIWCHIANGVATRFLMFTPAFRNMDAALEESARMSGSSNLGTLVRITFPLLLPAILATIFLGFIRGMESFETELLLGLPAGIYVYSTKVYDLVKWTPPQYPPAMALSTMFMAIVFLLVFIQRRWISRRQFVTVSGRGFQVRRINIGKMKYLAFALVMGFFLVSTVLPGIFLVLGTFMKWAGLFSVPEPFTTKHWTTVLSDPLFLKSLRNGLIVAVSASLLGMLFYSIMSYVVVRTNFKGRAVLDFMTWLPWAVPGVLLALGLLWVFLGTGGILVSLYGTLYILIVAMIVKEMPMGMRVMNGVMVQLGKELEESSRMMGAGWATTFRKIVAPLLAPAFVATSIIIFLAALKDISLTVLLYSHQSRTIAILMLEHYLGHAPEKGMVVGLILSLIALAVAFGARAFGMKLGAR